jgi:diguanylate cyclase (GGDEF)-like protein
MDHVDQVQPNKPADRPVSRVGPQGGSGRFRRARSGFLSTSDGSTMKDQRSLKQHEPADSSWPGGADGKTSERGEGGTARKLSQLSQETDGLLVRLIRLRQNLVQMRRVMHGAPGDAALAEANDELVRAALHAESIAETAVSELSELARSSQRDSLTNLPNRLLMLDRLENAIATARRHETRIAVLFIDLDNFKLINDTLGHAAGDQALQLAARRLQSAVRDSDTVSRHGGEEFLVLLPDISQAADAALIANKLLAALRAPGRAGEHRLQLSASIGITIYPEDAEDAQTLIDRADSAMYRSKRRSPGAFEFYAQKRSLTRRACGSLPNP